MQHYKRVGSGVNNITFSFDPAPLPSVSQLADGKTKKVQAKITLARPPKLNMFHRGRWKCKEKRSIFFFNYHGRTLWWSHKKVCLFFVFLLKWEHRRWKSWRKWSRRRGWWRYYTLAFASSEQLSFNLNSSDCKLSNVVFSSTIIMSSCGALWL